jgi:hypothetical protein
MPTPPRQLALELPPSKEWCQRWRDRRPRWRHRSEGGFDAGAYEVAPVGDAAARAFVERVLAKVRAREPSHAYVEELLGRFGATPRRRDDHEPWLRAALLAAGVRRLRHPATTATFSESAIAPTAGRPSSDWPRAPTPSRSTALATEGRTARIGGDERLRRSAGFLCPILLVDEDPG